MSRELILAKFPSLAKAAEQIGCRPGLLTKTLDPDKAQADALAAALSAEPAPVTREEIDAALVRITELRRVAFDAGATEDTDEIKVLIEAREVLIARLLEQERAAAGGIRPSPSQRPQTNREKAAMLEIMAAQKLRRRFTRDFEHGKEGMVQREFGVKAN